MPGIFINYRREDSGGYAQQIYRAMRSYFGAKLVFMDIDTIRSGEDFRSIIQQSIAESDVFLSIIGRTWLRSTDDKGVQRLSYPTDLVRCEIAQALKANLHVVPVLVGRAQMPRAVDLPEDLKALASRNAHEIPDRFFDQSVRQLIQNIRPHVRGGNAIPRRNLLRAALGAGGAFVGIMVLSVLKSRPDLPTEEQKAADATEKRHDAFEALVKQSPKQPPLLLRQPPPIHELPAEVPGPWRIDRADFTSFVAGPRHEPKPVWIARPSMNTSIIGFAPDRTLFRVDNKTVRGLRDGVERWAFEVGRLRGITPGGHIWLNAVDYSSEIEKSPLACFNSRGEGGAVSRSVKLPPNLIPVELLMYTLPPKPLGACAGGVVTLHGSKAAISVDGNCAEWGIVQDNYGRFYTGTDRNTIYCFDAGGKVLWTYKSDIPVDSEPKFSLGDPVFTTKEGLVCLRDGARRWFVPLQYCGIGIIDKTGTMFVTSHSTRALGYHSYPLTSAIDHDGRLLWTLPLPGFSMVLDPEGRLYMEGATSDNDQYLICLA